MQVEGELSGGLGKVFGLVAQVAALLTGVVLALVRWVSGRHLVARVRRTAHRQVSQQYWVMMWIPPPGSLGPLVPKILDRPFDFGGQ